MARSRQRDRSERGVRGLFSSQEALIYLAAAATLVLAAAVIIAGLYVTRYRPPRAHVLTVQDERYNASAIVDRGGYLFTYQSQAATADALARDTVDALVHEALFRLRGPSLIAEVTDEDVTNELRVRLGFPSLAAPDEDDPGPAGAADPDATPGASPTVLATQVATPVPTATPESAATAAATPDDATPDDRAAFAEAYQDFLQQIQLDRDQLERIIRAELIEQRLREHFGEAVGERGPQKRVSRIRVSDPVLAASIHEQLAAGADFAELHAEHSTGEDEGEEGDLGWVAPEALAEQITQAINGLESGQFSDVVASGLSYDLFLVTEVSADEPYDDDTRAALIDDQIEQWLELEEARVSIDRDLSDDEESWINEQILIRAREIVAAVTG